MDRNHPTEPSAMGWDFFVSYTTSDQAWAEWIAWQLEAAGFTVLFQKWDFVPGSHWTSRMGEGVAKTQHTLAILSEKYKQSDYCRHEWEAALRNDPDGSRRKLITIRIENCDRPDLMDGVVSFDLFDCSAEAARDRLLKKINSAMRGRDKPAEAPEFPGVTSPEMEPEVPDFPGEAGTAAEPITENFAQLSQATPSFGNTTAAPAEQHGAQADRDRAAIDRFRKLAPGLSQVSYSGRKKAAQDIYLVVASIDLNQLLQFASSARAGERVGAAIGLRVHLQRSIKIQEDPIVLLALRTLLADPDSRVRYRAAHALQACPEIVPRFENELTDVARMDRNNYVRKMAQETLKRARR